MDFEDVVMVGFGVVICVAASLTAVATFVYLPVMLYADMKCAEAGFPKSKVTINLARYCMNLDGSVTVKMEKLR